MLNLDEVKSLYEELAALERTERLLKKDKANIDAKQRMNSADQQAIKDQIAGMLKEADCNGCEFPEGNHVIEFYYTTPRKVVDIPDIDAVPDEYVKTTVTPDKKAIEEFLKQRGGCNWASFKDGNSNLNYKIRKV